MLGEGFAPSTDRVTLRTSLPMFWPVFGLSLLQYVAAALVQTVLSTVYYLLLIPLLALGASGTVGAIASLALSLLTFLVTALAYGYLALTVPALATEGRTAPAWIGKPLRPTTVFSSFERAFRLIGTSNLIRVALVMGGAITISVALICLLSAGVLGLIVLFAGSIGQTTSAVLTDPWTVGGVLAFSAVLTMSGLLAYVAAVQTLLYLDLRMRREALDLALRFDVVPIPQPSSPPPGPPPPYLYPQAAPARWAPTQSAVTQAPPPPSPVGPAR